MRGFRVAVVLLVGCSGAVAVSESGGDAGSTQPDAETPAADAAVIVDVQTDATVTRDAGLDAVVVDAGPEASDAEADAPEDAGLMDAGFDAGTETVVSVVTSRTQSCFLMSTGRLFCAGQNLTPTPTLVPGVTDAVEVTIGGTNYAHRAHTCVRRKGGTVDCWGAMATVSSATAPRSIAQRRLPSWD